MSTRPGRYRPEIFAKRLDKLVRRAGSLAAYIGQPIVIETLCRCDTCGLVSPTRCEIDGTKKTYRLEGASCRCETAEGPQICGPTVTRH
jgi:hypothetical protein